MALLYIVYFYLEFLIGNVNIISYAILSYPILVTESAFCFVYGFFYSFFKNKMDNTICDKLTCSIYAGACRADAFYYFTPPFNVSFQCSLCIIMTVLLFRDVMYLFCAILCFILLFFMGFKLYCIYC